jgi:hypothetical protein
VSVAIAPSQLDVYTAMIAFVKSVVPTGVRVVRALPNRVPVAAPQPGYVVVQAMLNSRLRQQIDTFMTGGNAPPTTSTIEQGIEVPFQIDCYGASAQDFAAAIATCFQDDYGAVALAPSCVPLFCNEGRQIPLTNEELAYEERWSLDAHVQWNPVATITQQYADALMLTMRDVTVEFPQ